MYAGIVEVMKCPQCGREMNLEEAVEENNEIIGGNLYCPRGEVWGIS